MASEETGAHVGTGGSTTPAGNNTPQFSQSIAGLVDAFELLKGEVGFKGTDDQEAAFKARLTEMEFENERLRSHAEDLILLAEQLKDDNEDLQKKLRESKVGQMVIEAQELTTIQYEYDNEVADAKVAEASVAIAELREVSERVAELEEDNRALTEMLNEARESQQQLTKLQVMVHAEEGEGATTRAGDGVDDNQAEENKDVIDDAQQSHSTVGNHPDATAGATGAATAAAAATPGGRADEATPPTDAAAPAPTAGNRTPGTAGVDRKDPLAVADALSAVAGGGEAGVVGVAARMLRDYHTQQQTMEEERVAKAALQTEVNELNEIVSSKTFKAPSAWAEREVKYKQDKRRWEEEQKQLHGELQQVRATLEELRTTSGATELEKRIEELEARLLESERQRDAAQAALHEMQIVSRGGAGEYSSTGVKPYAGPRLTSEGDVHNLVEQLESSGGVPGGTPGRSRRNSQDGYGGGDDEAATPGGEVVTQRIAALERENTELKAHLLGFTNGGGLSGLMQTPDAVRNALSASAARKARHLQDRLVQTQTDRAALQAELNALKDDDTQNDNVDTPNSPRVRLLLRVSEAEARAEVALLQVGVDVKTAHELAALQGRRQDIVLQKEDAEVAEDQIQALQEEQEGIEARMRDVAAAATATLSGLGGAAAVDVEDLPSPVANIIAAASTTSIVDANSFGEAQGESFVPSTAVQERLVQLRVQLNGSNSTDDAATVSAKERRIKELEALLDAKTAEEERLVQEMASPSGPLRLNFNVLDGGRASAVDNDIDQDAPATGTSRKSSAGSMTYNTEGLAQDRAAVEAAWEAHTRSSDVPSLIRAKVELETQVQMLQGQLEKSQEALAIANRQKGLVEESIDDAIAAGDVGMLAGLREGLRGSTNRMLSGRRFKVPFKRRGSPTFGRKIRGSSNQEADVGAGAATISKPTPRGEGPDAAEGGDAASMAPSDVSQCGLEDVEAELGTMRNENRMLMEHLVGTKVRLAEVEGDFLEARRSLLRSREIQVQLARQLREAQDALPRRGEAEQGATGDTAAETAGETQQQQQERRRSVRIPGIELKLV